MRLTFPAGLKILIQQPAPLRRQLLVAIDKPASAAGVTVNWPQIASASQKHTEMLKRALGGQLPIVTAFGQSSGFARVMNERKVSGSQIGLTNDR